VLMVQSRPSEDVLAVYDAHRWPEQNYLWRVMGRNGFEAGETPLVSKLQKAFEKASKRACGRTVYRVKIRVCGRR